MDGLKNIHGFKGQKIGILFGIIKNAIQKHKNTKAKKSFKKKVMVHIIRQERMAGLKITLGLKDLFLSKNGIMKIVTI